MCFLIRLFEEFLLFLYVTGGMGVNCFSFWCISSCLNC